MTLLTAHRILIGSATALFVLTAAWSFARVGADEGNSYLLVGFASLAAAGLFVAYFLLVLRKKT